MTVDEFIAKWEVSGGNERANTQLFVADLCDLLDIERPQPTLSDTGRNDYVFERHVVKTEIDGLYMAGASTVSHGVMGAAMSGLAAAQSILGCRMRDLLTQHGPQVEIYPSDDISAWPENLQARIRRGQTQSGAEEDDPLEEITSHG